MNSEFPNTPEDRLLDELLREQSHGPDEAFLQQIERAVDAGPPAAAKPSATRHYGRFAIAAGLALAAGGFAWFSSHNRQGPAILASNPGGSGKAGEALELEQLNKAIRDQEEKVEERRKVLATIIKSKSPLATEADQGSRGILQSYNELVTEKMQLESQINSLLKYDSDELMRYASGLDLPDNILKVIYPRYLESQRRLNDLKLRFADGNAEVIKTREELAAMKRQLDQGVVNLRATLQVQLSMANDRLKNVAMLKNDTHEEAIKRGLDAQDYVDAKLDFEQNQQELQAMKARQTDLASQPRDAMSPEKQQIVAVEMEGLNNSIREQEDRVEERRKVLGTIVRTKGIIYKGQDSYYGSPDARALDGQDYADARRDLAKDQQELLAMKFKQTALASRVGDEAAASKSESAEVGSDAAAQVQMAQKELMASKAQLIPKPAAQPAPLSELQALNKAPGTTMGRQMQGDFVLPGDEPTAPPEVRSGDRYDSFTDQPWKTADKDPLSTFSIDVDTASYANVRRMIQEGREVPKDAVRIEEFINAFKYHYQAPKGDAPFAVGATMAVCPWAPKHQLVRVSIKGREIEPGKRPASNLVFLVDVSGSMQSPDKLPLLKKSMETMVSQLDERDRVAIVVYAGNEGVALPSTRLDAEGRAKVMGTLAKLEAGGSTNGGAGIKRAYQLAMEQKVEGGVNRVILATDGDFNVGLTGNDALVKLVKERAQGGVYLTVAGFGSGNLNDAMMDAITRDGNGNYFYIDSEQEGRKVFLQNLAGTLVTIAKDVKIQVDFNPAKVGGYRLIGYANRVLRNEDFKNDKVDAGDIGAGHTVTAFYEISPPGESGVDPLKYAPVEKPVATDDWLTVKLRHKHPDGDESREIAFPLTGDALAIDKADDDFQFASAAALFGMKLHGMEEVRDVSWETVRQLAKPGLANDTTEDRAEFVSLVEKVGNISKTVSNTPSPTIQDDGMAVDGPDVRVIRHQDGSRSIFTRIPDKKTLLKKTYTADGVLALVYTYKVDAAGNPLGCKIADAQGHGLFKISYGYHKETGRLVEALMFDSQVKRVSPDTGYEMPVQKLVYIYDAEGRRSAPIAYNLLPGKTIEEVLGKDATVIDANPFQTTAAENAGGRPKPMPAPAEMVPGNR